MGKVLRIWELPKLKIRVPEMKRQRIDLIDERLVGAKNLSGEMIIYQPGGYSPLHYHTKSEHVFYFVEGKGKFILEGEEHEVRGDTVIFVKPGEKHRVINTGDGVLRFVEFFAPAVYDTVHFDDRLPEAGKELPSDRFKELEWEKADR